VHSVQLGDAVGSKNVCVVPVESYNGMKSCLKDSMECLQEYLLLYERKTPRATYIAERTEALLHKANTLLQESHTIRDGSLK